MTCAFPTRYNSNNRFPRLILFWICLLSAAVASAQLTPAAAFAASEAINADKSAVAIMDLASGEIIDSHNPDLSLIPASITKTLTIASLIEKTGIDYQYVTRVYAGGSVKDGCVEGNLVVVGSGDPTLGAAVEPRGTDIISETVQALRRHNISCIRGGIEVDEELFPGPATPPSWDPADLRQSYGTGCHALNWQRNASGSRSVANPAKLFASELEKALLKDGIEIRGELLESGGRKKLLLEHTSPAIDEIMRSCMMRSDNLYAEALLRTLALVNDKEATPDNAVAIEMKYWKKKDLPMQGVHVVDGSGLSRSNRLTARFLAELLGYMESNVDYASFFPLAGQEGTLRNFMKDTPLDGYIAMKTGSMNGIQCYAGYLLDDEYAPTHAVVVMINDFPVSRAAARSAVAKMLLDTFVPSASDAGDLPAAEEEP